MRSTGPILAVGAITVANQSLIGDQPWDWRVPVATGLAAGAFALMERAAPDAVPLLAWAALVTVLLTRIRGEPAPVERLLAVMKGLPT